ncbi:MAG TPA: hypothetical protein VGR73_03990 [Bryobacteraceae bacterium]|nr:hypothetical protein [Bryobacteraceae bacterium]
MDAKGKRRRIRHHSLETTDCGLAREKRDQFLARGQLIAPSSDLSALNGERVTIEDAVKFSSRATRPKSGNTLVKYQLLLNRRLLP